MNLKTIPAEDLLCLNTKLHLFPFRIDLAYARGDNLLFGERIYREDARLWLHKDLAAVVLKASSLAAARKYRLVLFDGLRTTDAQGRMLETQAVKDNPQWLEEPRLLSPPGAGAHPRGMAIDCTLEHLDGEVLDMGTAFDFLSDDPSPARNPAHREHTRLSDEVRRNRALLDFCIMEAAKECGVEVIGLAQEWWDFRLPAEVYGTYAPLSDTDLPPEMRMMD
jgi:D-alanyl-D-alanine dipeptidase